MLITWKATVSISHHLSKKPKNKWPLPLYEFEAVDLKRLGIQLYQLHIPMAGETNYKKKGKLSRQESNRSAKDQTDIDVAIDNSKLGLTGSSVNNQTKSRTGSRVYKIVVLGDGGVGKSGN